MAATIDALSKELEGLVKGVPSFSSSGFSVFDMEDLETKAEGQGLNFPLAGVMYAGATPAESNASANGVVPVAVASHAASLVFLQFTVVIAIQYHYAGQDDTKPQATALLDDLRSRIIGYKGVNSRPWQFVVERPEPEASGDGLAFYSQVWRTGVVAVGKLNNPT